MIAASLEHVTDAVGVALTIVLVVLFAVVDLVPAGHVGRRVGAVAAGSAFTALIALVAYRFVVLAQ